MKKIAIIGMGVAGVSVLSAMAKNPYYQDCHVVLYDQSQTFGTGLPYQPDSEVLLINQTADTMSLIPEDPLDFVRWVKKEKGISDGEKRFFPRAWFGEYLRVELSTAMQQLQPETIHELVSDLFVQPDGSYLVQSNSTLECYDTIHLCVGHLPYQDPYRLAEQKEYIYHPYPVNENLAHIPHGARVGIIGTGLTAIDLMRYFKHQEKEYQIHLFSRMSHFSLYRGFEPDITLNYLTMDNLKQVKAQKNGFVPLKNMIEWFQLECADKQVDFNNLRIRFGKGTKEQLEDQLSSKDELGMLQAIIHKMDPHLAEFMQALTEADKEEFYTEYEPLFKHFRTPMPKESLTQLLQLWDSGEVVVWNKMQTVEVLPFGFKVQMENKEEIEVDYLVNATGQDMQVKQSAYHSELMNQLVNKRILQPELFGGVQVLWPSAEPISQRYGVVKQLFVHGQLVQGIQYGNNARLLMLQAQKVVNRDAKRRDTK